MVSVSVIVSTYTPERLDDVLDCISSLKRQTFPPVEIILVLDPCETLVEFYTFRVPGDVKIVMSKNVGLSHARNAGTKNARGEVVAFIDDDAIADEKWLESIVRNYEDPHVLGVGGFVKPLWEGKRPSWFPEELYWIVGCSYKDLPRKKAVIRNPIGCNMSFRKSVCEKCGYFSTDIGRVGNKLGAHEDTEFSIRVARKIPSCKILYEPGAVVHHKVPKSRANLKYVARRSFAEGISKGIFSSQKSNPTSVLRVEKDYLRRLLSASVPRRLIRGYKPENLSQVLAILLSASLVLVGYLVTRARGGQAKSCACETN